jgi:hypothetical protein
MIARMHIVEMEYNEQINPHPILVTKNVTMPIAAKMIVVFPTVELLPVVMDTYEQILA